MSIDDVCSLGVNARDIVMLDFDEETLENVKYWARRTCDWFHMEGFIILESSEMRYHVVFDRFVSWEENTMRMAWVGILSNNKNLWKYIFMQLIKGSCTLRVSRKGEKPAPRVIFKFGSQSNGIARYQYQRRIILDLLDIKIDDV